MAFAMVSKGGFTPMVRVTVDGQEVAGGFYSRLIKLSTRDEAGQTSDQVTIELDDAGNMIARPRDKARIEVWLGYKETGLVKIGTFEMQSFERKGSVSAGETVTIQASAADLKKQLKGSGREAFEDKTFGDIVGAIAKRNGLTPAVDGELAKIKIPYRARIDASDIDFLTTLADEHDAVIKPMGTRLVAAPRGKAKSASGAGLAPIMIEKADCQDWSFSPDSRAQYGKVKTAYVDQKTGKRVVETAETGLEGPDFTVRDPLPNKEQAKKKSEAEARRLTRNTASGHFTIKGRPEAQAEADVVLGSSWPSDMQMIIRADSVEHELSADGFLTKIEVKAKEDGSSSKKD